MAEKKPKYNWAFNGQPIDDDQYQRIKFLSAMQKAGVMTDKQAFGEVYGMLYPEQQQEQNPETIMQMAGMYYDMGDKDRAMQMLNDYYGQVYGQQPMGSATPGATNEDAIYAELAKYKKFGDIGNEGISGMSPDQLAKLKEMESYSPSFGERVGTINPLAALPTALSPFTMGGEIWSSGESAKKKKFGGDYEDYLRYQAYLQQQ